MWKDEKGKEYKNIEDFGDNVYGFIYIITHKENQKFYVGKKNLKFDRKKKLGKKELKIIQEDRKLNKVQGKLPSSKREITESDWLDYWGSSKDLLSEIKKYGKDKFERKIIQLAYNSKQLTYFETQYQFSYNVLQRDDCYNNTVLGKFHRKDFI